MSKKQKDKHLGEWRLWDGQRFTDYTYFPRINSLEVKDKKKEEKKQ